MWNRETVPGQLRMFLSLISGAHPRWVESGHDPERDRKVDSNRNMVLVRGMHLYRCYLESGDLTEWNEAFCRLGNYREWTNVQKCTFYFWVPVPISSRIDYALLLLRLAKHENHPSKAKICPNQNSGGYETVKNSLGERVEVVVRMFRLISGTKDHPPNKMTNTR
jgi:hypothetical protein